MCEQTGCELSNPLYSEVHPGAVKTICLRALRLQRQGSLYRDVHDTNDTRWISFLADDGCKEGVIFIQAEWNRDYFNASAADSAAEAFFAQRSFAWLPGKESGETICSNG